MKKIVLTAAAVMAYALGWSQYNSPWTYTSPNTSSGGYVGIGTKSTNTATNTPVPNFNLHLHGTTDYTTTVVNPFPQVPTQVNWGKTTRIGLTNSTSGMTEFDGTLIAMSDYELLIKNRETGNATFAASSGSAILSADGIALSVSGTTRRAWIGATYNTSTEYSKFNIIGTTDNCLYLKVPSGKYGLSVRSTSLADNAIQVVGTDGTINLFSVKASGNTEIISTSATASDKVFVIRTGNATGPKILQVTGDGILRSREIIVDAQTWSDYVFEPDYNLLPLDQVRSYISENGHLPHVPSTAEVNEGGVNVAKTDAILLEKIEELTLYLLQQDEKMKTMQVELDALKKEQSDNK